MSDFDATPDPIDRAYVDAQRLLDDDDAAVAARRAAVLAAVSRQRAEIPAVAARRPVLQRYGRWLAAACVAGLGVFVALELAPTQAIRRAPKASSPPPVSAPSVSTPTQPTPTAPEPAVSDAASDLAQAPSVVSPLPPPPAGPAAPPAPVVAQSGFEPPAPAPAAAPPPRSAFPASEESVEDAVAMRRAPVAAESAPAVAIQGRASRSPDDPAARLRAAAAAGRLAELRARLSQGADVNAVDAAGETALMKAVRARQPAAAALLRARGADPDLENRAGESARDMARKLDDADLQAALGPAR